MNAKALKKGKCTGRCGLTGRYSHMGMIWGLYMGYIGILEKKTETTINYNSILYSPSDTQKAIGPHAWLLWECDWSGGCEQQPS